MLKLRLTLNLGAKVLVSLIPRAYFVSRLNISRGRAVSGGLGIRAYKPKL